MDHLLLHYDVASTIWSALFSCFGCPGLCLDVLLTCLIVGGSLAGQGVMQCGKWYILASFGVYGGK